MTKHLEETGEYKRCLAQLYLATRRWTEAVNVLENELLDETSHPIESYIYGDLEVAYLAMGAIDKAIEAQRLSEGDSFDPEEPSIFIGQAHMANGDFQSALKALRGHLAWKTRQAKDSSYQARLDRKPELAAYYRMELYSTLGLCYESLGRETEALACFQEVVDCYREFARKEVDRRETPDPKRMVHRSTARPLVEYASMLEKVGELAEAKRMYTMADYIFDRTTFVDYEDDEIYISEHHEVVEALQRINDAVEESARNSEVAKTKMPDLVERVGSIRLERKIVLAKRMNNYCEEGWTPPRYRGGQGGLAAKLLAHKAAAPCR